MTRISNHIGLPCALTTILFMLSLIIVQLGFFDGFGYLNLRVSAEERKKEFWGKRILYVNDDRFVNQHQRSPREQDTQHLALPLCSDLMDKEASNFMEVGIPYKYEMEIEIESQANYDSVMTQAIIAVENAVNKSLEKSLFSYCIFSRRRSLNSSTAIESNGIRGNIDYSRSLEMQGIMSLPSDSLDRTALCSHYSSSPNTECGIVNGGLYLYFNEGTDESVVKTYVNQALSTIKKNCENGEYTSALKQIINITFLDDKLLKFNLQTEPQISAMTTITTSFPKTMSYIVIASISSFFILLSMLCKNSDNEKELRSNASYVVECDLKMKPHSTINRRISELTVHPDDFDCEVMKRRASLESCSTQDLTPITNNLKAPPVLVIKCDEYGNTNASIALGINNEQSQHLGQGFSIESSSTATTEESDFKTQRLSTINEYSNAECSSTIKSPSSGSTDYGVRDQSCIKPAQKKISYQTKISDLSAGMDEYVRNT